MTAFKPGELENLTKLLNTKLRYRVMNVTDGIEASMTAFTDEQADQFIKDFPLRYKAQGYYKTACGDRIDPALVILEKELIEERAQVANDTLIYYDDIKNSGGHHFDLTEAMGDLLADLMQLADREKGHF